MKLHISYGDDGLELAEKRLFAVGEIELTKKEYAEYQRLRKKYDKWQQRFYDSFYDKQAK